MKYYTDGIMNILLEPLIISQNIETNKFPPSHCERFQPFDLVNDFDMQGSNKLNQISLYLLNKLGNPQISLYLLNKLGNPNLTINDIEESANEILEIKSFNTENITQVKMLKEQISEEFDSLKQL